MKVTPSQNETTFWRVESGAYGKAASALYRVMNGICQGITWGLMTTLTQCQQQVLDMLISYQQERGFPPTNQEVATMLGYRSVNAAVEHLRALEKKASSR